jgi:hypothetical protein
MATQRVVQSRTPAPTFGQLFGRALVRNVGQANRDAVKERADFLKIAPSALQQEVLTTTTKDDPDVIKFGGKAAGVGGLFFKPSRKAVDAKKFFETQIKAHEAANLGLASQKSIEEAYNDPISGGANEVRKGFAKKLKDAKTDQERLAVINEREAAVTRGLQQLINNSRNRVGVDANGRAQFFVSDGKGGVRSATSAELADPGTQFVDANKITPEQQTEAQRKEIEDQKRGQGDNLLGNFLTGTKDIFSSQETARDLGSGTRNVLVEMFKEAGRLPVRAGGALGLTGNVGLNFLGGLTGQEGLRPAPGVTPEAFIDVIKTGQLPGTENTSNLQGLAEGLKLQGQSLAPLFNPGSLQFQQRR